MAMTVCELDDTSTVCELDDTATAGRGCLDRKEIV